MTGLQITATENGFGYRVSLDGQEISSSLRSIQVHLSAERFPVAILELCIDQLEMNLGDRVLVVIPEQVKGLLAQQGWTPPPDEGD